ncbi:MAG: 2-hydroxyacyl-CoA dehydratase [Acidimicrobiales bacterium]
MPSRAEWAQRAEGAYWHPEALARAWRGAGGRVVGILGHDVPRELVSAAGMLPVRLAPARLGPSDGGPAERSPFQLAPDAQVVLDALAGGRLDWLDALVIGRDTEAQTKLFYVLRELLHAGDLAPMAVWFYDLLRVPDPACARYNRLRATEFRDVLGAWSGSRPDDDAVRAAIGRANATTRRMEHLGDRRRGSPPRLSGTDALVLSGAVMAMPDERAHSLIDAVLGDGGSERSGVPVFVTGSPVDDPALYRAVEDAGFLIAGEDHDWGARAWHLIEETPDPLEGLIGSYLAAPPPAARTGLAERRDAVAGAARRAGALAVLQLVFDHDGSAEWEAPGIAARLEVPFLSVRLPWPRGDEVSASRLVSGLERALASADG